MLRHRRLHPAVVLAAVALAQAPAPAAALVVGGGGNAGTDCLLALDAPVNAPALRPRSVRCTDGDACDADGAVNGSCRFPVGACANSTFDPACTLVGVRSVTVEHAVDDGDPRFDPQLQALQTRLDATLDLPESTPDRCTVPTNFTVPVRGPFGDRCRRGRKVIRIVTTAIDLTRDTDRLKLTCEPAAAGCDPRAFFAGTFDRIQRQVFNQSCAVSGCHDSETTQAELLLETGAAYTNLVNAVPSNADAAAAGWSRVMPGDPDASFLLHKLTGDLAPGFGARMPFGGPPLDASLVEIIRLWIAAGAPETGWVPGTD